MYVCMYVCMYEITFFPQRIVHCELRLDCVKNAAVDCRDGNQYVEVGHMYVGLLVELRRFRG